MAKRAVNRKMKDKATYTLRLVLPMDLFEDIRYVANQKHMTMVGIISKWSREGIQRYRASMVKRLGENGDPP